MLLQQSQRKRKCDCEAINNNAAAWGPDLVLMLGIPSTALPPVSSRSKNDRVFWARHKEHLHGIRKKGTALTERFRQRLKDCITQLWVMWQLIFCQVSCVDEHCLPLYCMWVRATAKSLRRSYELHVQSDSQSERAELPWKQATGNEVGSNQLCCVCVCNYESCHEID